MPTRYLRPGIRDSERLDSLQPLAEVLFYRLLVTVDDFGRFDARPAMVKAACFPVRDSVTAADCARLLADLQRNGLLVIFEVEGKPYLQLLRWENVPRAKASKYPQPHAHAHTCSQVHADADEPRTVLPVTETETETENRNPPTPRRRGAVDKFPEFWQAWPVNERKQDKAKCLDHWRRHELDAKAEAILADVRTKRGTEKWAGGFIEAPLVYLRGRRWEDGVLPASQAPQAPLDWRTSWRTIVAKGVEVGAGTWSEEALARGEVPAFPLYRAKVERLVREIEGGGIEAAQLAPAIGGGS